MYHIVFKLGLAVGPNIHVHFVSCEEKRREERKTGKLPNAQRT